MMIRRVGYSLLCLAFAFTACNSGNTLPQGVIVDSLVVDKSDHTLSLYQQGYILQTYKVALGKKPAGAKQFEGDGRNPEGLYTINGKNAYSKYYKNLGISYPNADDITNARNAGKKPGGDVKIHGLPAGQGFLKGLHRFRDWTQGCIAVSNEEMDEIYTHVRIGTPINILP